jgi:hypothetical protein
MSKFFKCKVSLKEDNKRQERQLNKRIDPEFGSANYMQILLENQLLIVGDANVS